MLMSMWGETEGTSVLASPPQNCQVICSCSCDLNVGDYRKGAYVWHFLSCLYHTSDLVFAQKQEADLVFSCPVSPVQLVITWMGCLYRAIVSLEWCEPFFFTEKQ